MQKAKIKTKKDTINFLKRKDIKELRKTILMLQNKKQAVLDAVIAKKNTPKKAKEATTKKRSFWGGLRSLFSGKKKNKIVPAKKTTKNVQPKASRAPIGKLSENDEKLCLDDGIDVDALIAEVNADLGNDKIDDGPSAERLGVYHNEAEQKELETELEQLCHQDSDSLSDENEDE